MMRRNGGTGKALPCVLGGKVTFLSRLTDEDELAIQSQVGSILGTVDGITQAFLARPNILELPLNVNE